MPFHLSEKKDSIRKILRIIIPIIIGALIVWFLLSKISISDILEVTSNISPKNIFIAFCLFTASIFARAFRFKMILRSEIGLGRIFNIVSLYMLLSNVLPMRAGELSYMYLLKKEANISGTKSFASLMMGAIFDVFFIFIATIFVVWHLRTEIISRTMEISVSGLFLSLLHKFRNSKLFMVFAILALIIITILILLRWNNYRLKLLKFWAFIKSKLIEILNELTSVRLDLRLLGIIFFSLSIMVLRFSTQWVMVQSMGLEISIWQFLFAVLFGVLFLFLPIHGPAGFGTIEAPWVLALTFLGVPSKDAIISGFSLHIMILLFCVILGLHGFIRIRKVCIK